MRLQLSEIRDVFNKTAAASTARDLNTPTTSSYSTLSRVPLFSWFSFCWLDPSRALSEISLALLMFISSKIYYTFVSY